MNILLDKKTKVFMGFSLKEEKEYENFEISDKEYKKFIELQSNGRSLLWNEVKNQLEAIKLSEFEVIDKMGEIKKDTKAEIKSYKDLLISLKKEKIQLKKDIINFEEFEEDTEYLKEQLEIKELEISELEEKLKKL
jgi:hypothetical protein